MRLVLNGIVSSDDDLWIYEWFGYAAFSPAQLRKAIADTPVGDMLIIEVNSPGGSVMAGGEMYSVLLDAPCQTRVIVQSYAASAASYFILGADEVLCTDVAQLMLHRPGTYTEGNVDAHQQSVQMLQSSNEAILNVYERRCKGKSSREDLTAIVQAETWITAQRALDLGLIDGIYDPKAQKQEQLDPRNIAAAFGLPDIVTLRARYAEAHPKDSASGEPPAQKTDDWRSDAALAIEKARYIF